MQYDGSNLNICSAHNQPPNEATTFTNSESMHTLSRTGDNLPKNESVTS